MSNVNDIIGDVGDALSLGDGCDLGEKDAKKIMKGLKRLLDRFSIDGRKLPTACQVEYKIECRDNRLSVGKDKRFNLWGSPVAIHYAAWKHKQSFVDDHCTNRSVLGGGLCEEPIRVNCDAGEFHKFSTCRELSHTRPTELFYQRGEIVFNSVPFVGDTLILRAVMPFDDQLLGCCDEDKCEGPEHEFKICPDHMLDHVSREKVLCLAQADFDGSDCWVGQYVAYPCGDECAEPVNVEVKAVKKQGLCPHEVKLGESCLPEGYYDSIVRILTYDLALYARIPRDTFMRQDRNEAIQILHRANARPLPEEKDLTTYWSRRCGDEEKLNIYGVTPRGMCG